MALSRRITEVKFEADDADWDNTIRITDMDIRHEYEYWGDTPFEKSVSSALRQNLRGIRTYITLSFEASTQSSTFRNLFNKAMQDLSDGGDFIYFYPDANETDKIKVIIPSFDFGARYSKTIGRFVPSIELIAYELETNGINVNIQPP